VTKKLAIGILGLLAVISYQSVLLKNSGSKVSRVIDGDTFETVDRARIRFDTLNAPELANCGGPEAKAALEKLLTGKNVRLVSAARDVSGRQIASVWVGDTWIDQKLIATGWVAYASSTLDQDHLLQNLDRENRQNKNGIYSAKCTQFVNPVNPKCTIKGNIVEEWVNQGEKIYHKPDCPQYKFVRVELYRGEQWFCTEKEALAAGYRKSDRCP
jgi:endonuclease YncB( thermonuclease family)